MNALLHFAATSARTLAQQPGVCMGANQLSGNNLSHLTIPNVCGVYLFTDTVSGGTYVGSSKRVRYRISLHFHDMKRFPDQRTYRKFRETFNTYGATVFQAELLQECQPEELFEVEKIWISKLQPTENLYVCTDGREANSETTRQKKSSAVAALWKIPEYRAKAIAARKGNAYCKGYKCTPEQVANRQRAARISNMKRNYGASWKEEYIRRYPEHAEDVNG